MVYRDTDAVSKMRVVTLLKTTWQPSSEISQKTGYSVPSVTRIGHEAGVDMKLRNLAILEYKKAERLLSQANVARGNSTRMFVAARGGEAD